MCDYIGHLTGKWKRSRDSAEAIIHTNLQEAKRYFILDGGVSRVITFVLLFLEYENTVNNP